MRGVKPLIFLDVVVLTSWKLNLIIGVIPSKGIDDPLVMNCREESLLLWHLGLYLDGLMIKMKACVYISVATQDVVPILIWDENSGEVSWEVVFVLSCQLPFVRARKWSTRGFLWRVHWKVCFHLSLLQLLLFELRMIECFDVHTADPCSSKLKPKGLVAHIHE